MDFTRPGLFRAFLYFILLYALFRYREWFAVEPVAWTDAALATPGKWLTGFFLNHPVWKEIILFLTAFSSAFSITRILSRNLIYLERTFISVLVYPLTALGYGSGATTPVVMLAALLLIFAIDQMIKSHKQEGRSGFFLNASVALGAAGVLYPPAVVFFLLLPVGFVLFRQSLRSMVIALLGFVFPIAFYSYIRWGMGFQFGEMVTEIATVLKQPESGTFALDRIAVGDWTLAGVFLLLTVIGVIGFFRRQTQMRRRTLRGFVLFLWTLLFALSMAVFSCRSVEVLPLIAVPLTAVIPAAFNRKTGWIPNLLYLLMLWIVLTYNLLKIFPWQTWPL
jgi:hypothetical protein